MRFWLVTVAALLGIALTVSLGRWQLSRAAEKEALQAAIDAQGRLPALGARDLLTATDTAALLHRTVRLRGLWINERTVYLDNRQMRGQPGFFVVTPLALEHSAAVVLVQRGWIQRNFVERNALQPVATPPGIVEIEGRVVPPPSRLYEFAGEDKGLIRQNLELRAFADETGLPLQPLSVQQTGDDAAGLLRDWPAPNTGVDKHYGYAFQWFGLAALLTGLYVWFQFVRRPSAARRALRGQ
ncbi:SURF1 family protein [Pseudorhodoferax sp. Leaf267]|uniref:SURF1 family protein n=1 Tax=Pseudorhodoferax sp. Leaf267 TaxID=1736316 RepID=UPI0009E662D6|nr:SURF1 family protein [Pseudorhodoferax sp. Leaf267]